MPDKITLVTDDFSGPKVSEKFLSDLKAYDPTLLVRWNSRKMRFVVEQCTTHHAPTAEHSHLCERIYVLLVQDPEGGMMGLHSGVIEQIKARDVTKAGFGPDDLHKWTKLHADNDEKVRADIDRKQSEAIKHASAYGRAQLIKAFNQLENCGTPNR